VLISRDPYFPSVALTYSTTRFTKFVLIKINALPVNATVWRATEIPNETAI
jgi:hypothetical protein